MHNHSETGHSDVGHEAVGAQANEVQVDPFEPLSDEEKTQFGHLLDRVIAQMEESLPGGADPRMQRFKEVAFGGGASDDEAIPPDTTAHPDRYWYAVRYEETDHDQAPRAHGLISR